MKKFICYILLIILLFTGCNSGNDIINKTNDVESQLPNNESLATTKTTSITQKHDIASTNDSESDNEWYVGTINNNLNIHLNFETEDNKATGVYYYDKYNKEIELNGFIEGSIITLREENPKNRIELVAINDNLYKGAWIGEDKIYPIQISKDNSGQFTPSPLSEDLMRFSGSWTGKSSDYYSGSNLYIHPLFDDFVKIDISAISGTHMGGVSAYAVYDNNSIYFEGDSDSRFVFTLNDDGDIELNATNYIYYCGMGVSFDNLYANNADPIEKPSAKDVGLVYTDEQETIFKQLTKEHYDIFIDFAQYYADEHNLDDIDAKVRSFGILGYTNAAIVMIDNTDNSIMAAVIDVDNIYYYTNNDKYNEMPKTIQLWCAIYDNKDIIKVVK